MLGSFANPSGSNAVQPPRGQLRSRAAAKETKRQDQILKDLLAREWPELPYAMMRITASRRPWDTNRVYWRDRTVQLGDIDLSLLKTAAQDDVPRYAAAYTQEELRRELALHPSLEDDQLRWAAPGICAAALTTDQLAEKLLGKLVTFYTTGLSSPSATCPASTCPASPDLSS